MLLYFTMTMGISLVAAGRQRAWAATQLGCVAVSLIFDPLLVPWFQNRTGNGGIGLCVTSVASEVLMLGAGIWLMPRGVFDRALFRELLLTVLAGTAMVGAARLMSSLSPFVAGPLALFVYVGVLFSTGGLDKEQLGTLASVLRRKFARS